MNQNKSIQNYFIVKYLIKLDRFFSLPLKIPDQKIVTQNPVSKVTVIKHLLQKSYRFFFYIQIYLLVNYVNKPVVET